VTQPKIPSRDAILDTIEHAPVDDQPISEDERRAIAEVKKRGRFVTTAAVRARLAERTKPR
jgi:hypothetical protein